MKNSSLLVVSAAALLMVGGASAADFSSNSVGYRYAPSMSEPGVSDKVAKNILTFTHFSVDKLGTNFFTIDLLKSDRVDPANNSGSGATEYYGFYQREFSLSALSGNTGGYGLAKDLKLVGRFDAGTKNTAFAPAPKKLRVGISAALPVSAGFWDVGVQGYKETNYNGITGPNFNVGKNVTFDWAPALVSAWAIPVSGLGTFTGFVDVIGPKGTDGFGGKTKTEVLARATFMFDVLGPKSGLTVGVGVEYWKNKFGDDNSKQFVKDSSTSTTPLLLANYTF